jgi:predicted alpha/beta-fold hydrolase
MLDTILAEYRRSLEAQDESMLKTLIEHYGLSGHDKQSYINALVEHFKKQLETNG